MKITWFIIGVCLFVLGSYAGYEFGVRFGPTDEVEEERSADEDEGVVDESLLPSSITASHLSAEEERELLLALIEANRDEGEMLDDAFPVATSSPETEENDGELATSTEEALPLLEHEGFVVQGAPRYPAEGVVRLVETPDGTILRFEDFSMLAGPELHLYLATDLSAQEYIDLGPIKGMRGNINYVVPEDVDLSEYRYVLHISVPFGIVFNYAEISAQ